MFQTFCQTLFHMTWTAAAAALAVMVLRLFFRRVPRSILCALWLVVFLRMVCPVSFTLPVSLVPEAPTIPVTAVQTAQPAGAGPEALTVAEGEVPAARETVPAAPAAPAADPYQVLFALWLAGFAGMLLWGGASCARLGRRIADAVRVEGNIYESDRIDSPFVCGLLRPRIYLPAGLAGEDRRYVLLHEQAHIRRGDHWTRLLAWPALALHWFNPVLWIAYWLFGRDVETACDQRVIRDFDRTDVAGYAAALFHLGRDRTAPRAVPLAFGEENARGRIRHVLSYKHPALFVVIPAVILCAAVSILLLANPGDRNGQLGGVEIAWSCVLDEGVPVDLPQELQKELMDLIRTYDKEAYQPIADFTPSPGDLVLSNLSQGTSFYLTDSLTGRLTMVRTSPEWDGYSAPCKMEPMEGLSEDPAWQLWQGRLEDYLETGRAEDLYALKTPYIGDPSAVGKVLRALHVSDAAGQYTMELQTAREPYGLILNLANCPVTRAEQMRLSQYQNAAAPVILSLIGNAGVFEIRYDNGMSSGGESVSMTAEEKAGTLEQFREIYRQYRAALSRSSAGQGGQTYRLGEALYLSQELPFRDMTGYDGTVVIRPEEFYVQITHALSSAMPEETRIPSPKYRQEDSETRELTARDGTVIPVDAYTEREFIQVYDRDSQVTGYRIYRMDDEVWLGYWGFDAQGWDLEWLFRLAPAE